MLHFLRYLPLIFFLASCTADHEKKQPQLAHQYLFLIKAKSADVSYEGKYFYHAILTLKGVDFTVTYYDNVLQRKPQMLTLEAFLTQWSQAREQFQNVPPVVELMFSEKGADQIVSLELKEPLYDAEKGELTFYVYFLSPFSAKALSDITLFIKGGSSLLPEPEELY